MPYDDAKYNVIERQWFGLTQKHGGADTAFTVNESEATKVTRWYPRGPIVVKKFGAKVLGTVGKGEQVFSLYKGTQRLGAVVCSTTAAPYTIASDITIASGNVDAGSYLSILASTNVCSTGTFAVFVDFVRRFKGDANKWAV